MKKWKFMKNTKEKTSNFKNNFLKNDKFWWFFHVLYFYFFIPRILLVFHKWWQKMKKPLLKDFYIFSFYITIIFFWRDHDFAPSEPDIENFRSMIFKKIQIFFIFAFFITSTNFFLEPTGISFSRSIQPCRF